MIVISDKAEKKLLKKLEAFSPDNSDLHCAHLKLSHLYAGNRQLIRYFIQEIGRELPQKNAETYICHDHDIFVCASKLFQKTFANILKKKPFQKIADDIQKNIQINDLSFDLDRLIEQVQEKETAMKMEQSFQADQEKLNVLQELELIGSSPMVDTLKHRRDMRKQPEILIIEDDVFTQRLIAKTVDRAYRANFAETAKDALMQYISMAPDMVLLDIGLPDLDGHELLKWIFKVDPDAYVVMLSGNSNTQNVVNSVQNGAKGFIGKPFNKAKLSSYAQKSPYIKAKLTKEIA